MSLLQNETLIPLDSVQDFLEFKDLGKDLHYSRVFTPNGTMSDYFNLFYKDENTQTWNTKNGMLSKVFTIAKTENVLNDIIRSLSSEVLYRRNKSYKTYSVIDFTLRSLSVLNENIEKDEQINLFLFKLMSGIDPLTINTKTELSFSLMNAFGGEHTLSLSYGLMTNYSILINGKVENKNINNLIVLDSFSTRLIHNTSMSIDIGSITEVKNKIEDKIRKWKEIKIEEDEMKIFEDHFNKKFMKKFSNYLGNIPGNIKNLFFISYLLSFLFDDEKNVSLYRTVSLVFTEIERRHT